MPTSYVHASIILPNKDGLVVDEFETSLNYAADTVDSTGMTPLITAFFNTAGTGQTEPLCYYLSQYVSRTALAEIRYYDKTTHLDGTPSGGPFEVDTFTVGAIGGGSTPWPNQDCATLSYYDALTPGGVTTARNRGRMFLGPLGSLAGVIESTGGQHLLPQFCTDATKALQNLVAGMLALSSPKVFCVWSRKNAGMYAALGGWMENKIDTQRRRAYAGTARTSVTF